ncbi:MAG: FAD-binding oxidoreductase [Candidatus Schekmanbacteria bacterium]|nr:MAG: FAD-binding oxidoreductase [Candidatus Schekmanbacteria bacterium]
MALPIEAKKELIAVVGEENFTDSKTKCEAYSRGGYGKFSWDRNRKIPGCVVLPSSTEEVQAIVKIANRYKLPYIPLGTFYIALCVPIKPNTIMIDMKRMDKLEIDEENMYAIVEPYVTYTELQTEAMKLGLYTSAPSCGAQVSVIANHLNQGMGQLVHRVGYANRRVLAAEWILPDGELIRTGSATNGDDYFWGEGPGPDLRGIMRGWFGNFGGLGIVTKMAVKLFPMPFKGVPKSVGVSPNTAFKLPEDRFKWFTIFFPTTEKAIDAMYEIGHSEIAAVSVRVPFIWRYIARAKSRDDFAAKWNADKHKFGKATPSMVRVMLVGFASEEQLEYEEKVLRDIVSEIGGEIEEASPYSSGQVFKLGISSNVTVPAGFFAVTKFAFDSLDHARRALSETADLKANFIPPFFDDSEESGWMQSYDMGHIGYGEFFSYFDKSMVDKFLEYEVASIDHDIKMGAYPGAQWSQHHEQIGKATGNYHLLMEKIGKSFDPKHVSNPTRLVPTRGKK